MAQVEIEFLEIDEAKLKALATDVAVPRRSLLNSLKSWLYNHDMHAALRAIKRASKALG